jgi:hypothetical protein
LAGDVSRTQTVAELPRELSGFEIEAFFTFTASERALIEVRRGPSLKLGLALPMAFCA